MLLMHKDNPVADVVVSGGRILGVNRILSPELIPVGTNAAFHQLQTAFLQRWNEDRAIPHDRQFREHIEASLGCTLPEAKFKSMGVSLTDCYWFKENDEAYKWSDVNFFQNTFSDSFSQIILGDERPSEINYFSPDFTTDGLLAKAWIYADGVPTLVKFGNLGPNAAGANLLSANEVAASRVAAAMEISHVPYYPVQIAETGIVACACPGFVQDDQTEFISAMQLIREHHFSQGELFRFFRDNSSDSSISGDIRKMIAFDHIIHNNDRHEKNFGLLRDSDTLQYFRMAPLFDSGSSFGWNNDRDLTKPFCDTRQQQLALLDSMPCIIPSPKDIKDILREAYESFSIPERIYDAACRDVGDSFRMIAEVNRTWLTEMEMFKDEDIER